MDRTLLGERLETACRTFTALERQLADPAIAADPGRLQRLARERARLEPLVHDYQRLEKLEQERLEARALLRSPRAAVPAATSWQPWRRRSWSSWSRRSSCYWGV